MAVIGIDLGTTNSLASVYTESGVKVIPNSLGNKLTPSVVGLDDEGKVIVGEVAKERLITHPERTAAEFKRTMGTDKTYKLGEESFSSQQLSSILLRKIVADAKAHSLHWICLIQRGIIHLLAIFHSLFDDKMRTATKQAAEMAGIKCERLINEPSAAALAYLYKHGWKDGTYMVVDFGGGTLDVSIIDSFDSVMEIIAVAGNNHLGGKDINEAIYNHFCLVNNLLDSNLTPEERAIIYRMSETTKIALSTNPLAVMSVCLNDQEYSLILDNNSLIKIAHESFEKLFEPIKKALKDSRLKPNELEAIVLVGGSCKMPTVAAFIEEVTGVKPSTDIDPDTAIAVGAGIFTGIKAKNQDLKDIVMTDICPFSLGVGATDNNKEITMSFIIERNSMLPSSASRDYYAVKDRQTEVNFKIYQGESIIPENNIFLGAMKISCPPTQENEYVATVRMTYDINGILIVDLTNREKKTVSKVILDQHVHLSEKEIEQIKGRLDKLRFNEGKDEEEQLLISKAERIIEETMGFDRERVIEALERFKFIMKNGNTIEKRKAKDFITKLLESYED